MGDAVKVTVNLPDDLIARLKELAGQKNKTVTELIRRGLETELFLAGEEAKGGKVLIEKSDRRMIQIHRS
jgi:predicted transcriptional regulator